MGVEVGNFQPQLTGHILSRNSIDTRQAYVAVYVRASVECDGHKRCVLKGNIHLENVVGWRQDHLFFVGHDHGLKHIDHLGDVCHTYAVGMAGEDIKVECCEDGVALAVLLHEKPRIAAR